MLIFKNKNTTVFQSHLFQLNSTVVATEDLVLVVDPGYLPQEIDEISRYVNRMKGDRSLYLFFTHSDYDHIAGAGAFPEAKMIASKEFTENPFKEKQLKDIQFFDDEFYITRPYEMIYPNIDYPIESDGEEFVIGETVIKFYHAFGHTGDGLLAAIAPLNLLLAGDYLSDIEFPFVCHSFLQYKKTLEIVKNLLTGTERMLLVPGHGNVTDEVREILGRINDAKDYFKLISKEKMEDEELFKRFCKEKQYDYLTNLKKRHQENLEFWKEQGK